jgi:hypothetical protein
LLAWKPSLNASDFYPSLEKYFVGAVFLRSLSKEVRRPSEKISDLHTDEIFFPGEDTYAIAHTKIQPP